MLTHDILAKSSTAVFLSFSLYSISGTQRKLANANLLDAECDRPQRATSSAAHGASGLPRVLHKHSCNRARREQAGAVLPIAHTHDTPLQASCAGAPPLCYPQSCICLPTCIVPCAAQHTAQPRTQIEASKNTHCLSQYIILGNLVRCV